MQPSELAGGSDILINGRSIWLSGPQKVDWDGLESGWGIGAQARLNENNFRTQTQETKQHALNPDQSL